MHDEREKITIRKYLQAVQKYYTNISPEDISVFQEGYDHDVLVINNTQAFRFPRTKDQEQLDLVENIFLSEFAFVSPISVQKMISHDALFNEMSFQIYKFIPGLQLTKKLDKTLTEQELIDVARDMGKFLIKLHSFPLEKARLMKIEELDPKTYWIFFEDLQKRINNIVFPLLTKIECDLIKNSTKEYVEISKKYVFKPVVTHSDLLGEHIIIDEKTHKLNGVIDFSLRIADPAIDFQFFDRYGNIFLKTIYENYLRVDEHFDLRRKFYALHVPVVNLFESIEKKDEKMIKTHLLELKEYIANQL